MLQEERVSSSPNTLGGNERRSCVSFVCSLTISADKTSAKIGESIHFSGFYTKNGAGVPFYEVSLDKDGFSTDGYADSGAGGACTISYYCNKVGSFSFTTVTTDPTGTATSTRFRGSISDSIGVTVTEDGEEPTWPKPIRTFLAGLIERLRGG